MSDLEFDDNSEEIADEVHVKKHDHSGLGKHTKEEKKKYLEGFKTKTKDKVAKKKTNNTDDLIKNNIEEHVKKHDHSGLGKHSKAEKMAYLEGLRNTVEEPFELEDELVEDPLPTKQVKSGVKKRKKTSILSRHH